MSSLRHFSILCTVKEGRLKLFDKDEFARGLSQFGDGEELELQLGEIVRKKTRAQEKFFHGPVLKAFEELGYRKQEAKDMLCLQFIPQEIKLPDGSMVRVPGHTSGLSIKEYNDLIEACIQLAAENGQYIMDGGEWRASREKASAA